jgi:hypothetical protein
LKINIKIGGGRWGKLKFKRLSPLEVCLKKNQYKTLGGRKEKYGS